MAVPQIQRSSKPRAKQRVEDKDKHLLDPLQAYLNEIRVRPRISVDEERHLWAQLHTGRAAGQRLYHEQAPPEEQARLREAIAIAEAARQKLLAAHLPLVVALARPYANRGVPLLDLIQEGNLALLQAIEKFDPQYGARLATYATWWIRQAIRRAVLDQGRAVRVLSRTRTMLARLRRSYSQLAQELGREPSQYELARHLGIDPKQVLEWLPLLLEPVSLDMPVGQEREVERGAVIADAGAGTLDETIAEQLAIDDIRTVLLNLDPIEQRILILRYGLDDGVFRAPEEVGALLGLSRAKVRQREGAALRKLRSHLQANTE